MEGGGISDAALARDPRSAEAIIGDLGHHVLVGAPVAGSALGAAAGQAAKGLNKITAKLQKELADSTEGMLSTSDPALRDEVMAMNRPQLEAAHRAEAEALRAGRLEQGTTLAGDLQAFHGGLNAAISAIRQQLPDKALADGVKGPLNRLEGILGDKTFAEKPTLALGPLRRLEQSMTKMQDSLPADALKPALEQISTLQDRIADMVGSPTSDRLVAFGERMKMMDRPPPRTPMLAAASVDPGATAGAFGEVVKPLMKRVLGSFTEHAAGVENFMTKLGAPGPAMDAVERLAAASTVTGGNAYERATKAITSAASDPQGTQGHLDEQLAGLAHAAPETAAQVKQGLLAKINFLASKVPPATAGLFGGSEDPPDSVKATFARYVAGAEDPLRVVKELRARMVMPETVEAAQALYPQHLERLKQEITTQLADPKVRGRVTYPMRLQLAMILGPQVDPTLDPGFIAMMQAPKVQQAKPPTGAPEPTSAQRLTTGGLQ